MNNDAVVLLRKRLGAAVVDNFFRGLSYAGSLHPKARPERHGVEVLRDIPYRDSGDRDHLLDVYRPADAAPGLRPVVFYVHGGGFRILSKDTHWIMGLAFARAGYVVFNINYRLAPRHPYPAAIDDVCAAFAWAAENAERYGGDRDRFVFAGESAGANLVAALTVATSWQRPEPWARPAWEAGVVPRAVVPACGIFQVSDPERFRRRKANLNPFIYDRILEVSESYLGGPSAPESAAERDPALADPLLVFERANPPERPLPPFFLPVGTADPLLDDTRRLKAALERLGAESSACYYEGEVHAFHAAVWRPNARRCWQQTFAFLERHVPRDAR